MRIQPDFDSYVIAVLSKGDKLDITGTIDGSWVKVLYNGKKGYLRNNPVYIKIIDENNLSPEKKASVRKEIIDRQIRAERKKIELYEKKAENIIAVLDEIEKSLNNAQKRLDLVKKDYLETGDKIREEEKKIFGLEEELNNLRPFVNKRIVALSRFSRVGQMNILFSAESVVNFIKLQKSLKKIINADIFLIKKYTRLKKNYMEAKKSLEREKNLLAGFQKDIANYLGIKESEKNKKRELFEEIRKKKNLRLSVIENLKRASRKLDKTIADLKSSSGNNSVFRKYKGLLSYPVKGEIVSRFGKGGSSFYQHKNGVGIKAELGEPVQSVFSGNVVFSDWIKGYGNIIIIDHGDGFHSVYGHVQEFFKKKGDKVIRDEVIATLGETGSMSGPVLHFELRQHGVAVDPAKWIKKK